MKTTWTDRLKALEPKLVEACTLTSVAAGPNALIKELGKQVPELPFRRTLCRGGWYRLGGVVAADGSRVSDDLEQWVEQALLDHDGDFQSLHDAYVGSGLRATRRVGRTHYFVSLTGDTATDFVQLEVEDLQEVLSHTLFDEDSVATSVEDLVDHRQSEFSGQPIGLPTYAFRRITAVNEFLAKARAQQPEPQAIHRFIEDWSKSSAGNTTALCNHWVIGVREHLDRYRQPIYRAQPVPAIDGGPPAFTTKEGVRELALHDALIAFDRQVGYPFAWFFHLLTTKAVPHWVARVVVEDALAGFAYLPRRDEEIVRNWLHQPYRV